MSLVKKLQSGGSVDNDALNLALNNELATFNLKSKDERKVRDALVQLRDFAAQKGNTFSADELAKKYTVSGEGSEKFQGSPDEIRANWLTGKLKIKDEQDAMSVAAAIYGNATKSMQKTPAETAVSKEKLGIGDLGTYVTEEVYGTPEALQSDFYSITSDEERKKKILDYAGKHVSSYLQQAELNKDRADYTDIEKAKAIQEAITTGDWDKFKMASYQVKWNPGDFLLTEPQKQALAGQETLKKQQESRTNLTNLGFAPELADAFITAGFKNVGKLKLPAGTKPETAAAVEEFIKTKGLIVLENAGGQQRVVTANGQPIDVTGEEFNQFSPLNGIAWKHDPNTGLFSFTKSVFKLPDYGNVGVGIQGTIPGYEGWKITGWSGTDETPEGGRDYTKHLVLEKDGTKVYLNKDAQGNYRFKDGSLLQGDVNLGQPKLTGFTGARTNIVKFDQLYPKLYDAQLKVPINYNHSGDLAKVREAVRLREAGDVKGMTGQAATRLISALMYDPKLRNNQALKTDIMALLADYHDILSGQIPGEVSTTSTVFKKGGIFKFQGGGSAQRLDAYIKKMQAAPQTTPTDNAPKTVTDIKGTWKDMSSAEKAWRKASIAGTVGSFAPVYGAIGAGVTLGADIMADVAKDGFQASDIFNWNTAANLGFVALSAIGLGGVKALVKAGKAAKTGVDIAKTASKAKKLESALALTAQETKALDKVVKLAERVGAKTPEQLATRMEKLRSITPNPKFATKFANEVKTYEDGLEVLNTVAKSSSPLLGSIRAGQVASAVGKGAAKIPGVLGGKAVRTGLRVAGVAPGVMALPGTVSTWYNKGFEYTKPEDIKKIAIAGSIGKNWVKDIQGVKAIRRQTTNAVSGTDKTTLTINGEEVTINKAIELPKEVGRLKGLAKGKFSKSSLTKENEASFAKYKEKLASAAKEEGVILRKSELDNLKPTDIDVSYSTPTGTFTLGAAPTATGRGRVVDVRDYNLAKKYLGKSANQTAEAGNFKELKTTSPEKRAELNVLKDKKVPSKNPNLTNKELAKEIKDRKAVIATSKKNPINEKILVKRKQQLEAYLKEYKKIQKGQSGLVVGAPHYAMNAFTATKKVPKKETKVETKPRFLNGPLTTNTSGLTIKGRPMNLDPMPKLPALKFSNKTTNVPAKQPIAGSTDPTKVIMLPEVEVTATNLRQPLLPRTFTPLTLGLNGVVNNPIPKTPSQTGTTGTTGTDINADINQTPGALNKLGEVAKGMLNPTNLANLAMYTSTVAANKQIGQAQRKAIADSLYSLPGISQTYLRIDKPSTLLANKQAANVSSQASRIARATSDLDKGRAIQLQGQAQASDIVAQGQQADLARIDKLRAAQLENKAQVDQYNTQVLAKNRALSAEAAKNLHLINANQILAQNAALANFIRSAEKNQGISEYKAAMDEYWKFANDPALKAQTEAYQKEAGPEGEKAARAIYEEAKAAYKGTDYAKSFEESQEHAAWQKKVADLGKQLDLAMEPIRKKQMWMQLYQPMLYMKKGGGLTREDKIAIDKEKFYNARRLKDTEMTYKAIMHNNEMLQKALIKVFK